MSLFYLWKPANEELPVIFVNRIRSLCCHGGDFGFLEKLKIKYRVSFRGKIVLCGVEIR